MLAFYSALAREITYDYLWSTEGDYNVDITLENLHSTEDEFGHVKYIHNFTQIVHVQYPVVDFKDDGVLLDWFVTDDVDFFLTLDVTYDPPSSLHYNCTWGDSNDNYNVEFDEAANRDGDGSLGTVYTYHIRHKYTTANIYDVSCILFNMVSSQNFSKTVSLMFHILIYFRNIF